MSNTDEVLEPENDGVDQSRISDALAQLTHLNPAFEPAVIEPMPDYVWEQLNTVLALEEASRAGGGSGSEILSFPAGGRRRLNMTSGLIAASVALLAVGIAVVALRPADAPDLVASSPVVEAGPSQILQAGFVPPARAITQSDLAYTPDNVVGEIDELLTGYGVNSPQEMMTMTSPPSMKKAMRTSGFMASDEALRNCITMLTKSERSQALIVDRAKYMGSDAGVIVIPAFMAIDISTPPPADSPLTMTIWVVGPNCGEQDGAVLRRFTHTLD